MTPEQEDPVLRKAADAEQRAIIKSQKESEKRNKEKIKNSIKPPSTPENSDRLSTWWRVQVPIPDLSFVFTWMFAVMVVFVLVVSFLPFSISRLIPDSVIVFFVFKIIPSVCIAILLFSLFSCIRFFSWRRRLPFELSGWEQLVDFPGFGEDEEWRHCSVVMLLKAENNNFSEFYRAALVVFIEKANSCYFASDDSSSLREWAATGLTAYGSANRHVARQIKKLCEGNLKRLHKKYGRLQKVIITIDSERFFVSRPTGNGVP